MPQVENNTNSDNQFQIEDLGKLGEGGFSTVRKAKYVKDNVSQFVALKILKDNSNSSKIKFLKEVDEMRKTDHPNIIKLIDCCEWKDKYDNYSCMILELADFGSLSKVLNDRKYDYTFGHAVSWLYQCSDAINYLHSRSPPTIHRDLKPLNLLLTNGGTVLKLCDFGTVSNLKTIMTNERGTYFWMAPEVIQTENYNEKCDVYSYTIIAWEVFCRKEPYFHLGSKNNVNQFQVIMGVIGNGVPEPFRPLKISKCPNLIRLLFERGMDMDPLKRPSMNFIYKLMKRMDEVVNKEPIKPLVPTNRDSVETVTSCYETSDAESECNTIETKKSNLDLSGTLKHDNIRTLTLSREMLNGTELTDEDLLITDKMTPISRDRFGSFKVNYNPVSETKQTKGHRKSKSIGNSWDLVPDRPPEPNKDSLKSQIVKQIESMLYDPIEPISNINESIRIYNDHKKLITDDKNIQREIDNLKPQIEQLKITGDRINEYNDLLRRKKILIEENKKLRSMVNMNSPK